MNNSLESQQLSSAGSWKASSKEFSTPEDQIISGAGFDINNHLYQKRILSHKQSEELSHHQQLTYYETESSFSPLGHLSRTTLIEKNETCYNRFVLSNLATDNEMDFEGPSSSSNLFSYHYNVKYSKIVCSSPTVENTPHSGVDDRKFSICSEDSAITLTNGASDQESLNFSRHKTPFKKFKSEFSNIEEFDLNDSTHISRKDFDLFWNSHNKEKNVSKKRKIATTKRQSRASSNVFALKSPVKFSQ